MNTGDSDICMVRVHGFRVLGLCPRPGMTTFRKGAQTLIQQIDFLTAGESRGPSLRSLGEFRARRKGSQLSPGRREWLTYSNFDSCFSHALLLGPGEG